MKLLGHPIHPLLVHFPTALLPMDLLLSILHYTRNDESFGLAGLYCLWAGVAAGLLAVITGITDLVAIPKDNKAAWAQGLYHGAINTTIILVFAAMAYKAWQAYPAVQTSAVTLILKGILVCGLFIGNYLGGRLIYKHFIGIERKQKLHESTL
jgi:uncharacterized membrane protein